MKQLLLAGLLGVGFGAQGQQIPGIFVPKDIVILQSTRDYAAALAGAKQAASRLRQPLELMGKQPNKNLGLSFSKAECATHGFEYPCYVPRGQGGAEDSYYISVEFSTGYSGFAKGYYLVVAALAPPRSISLRQTLARVQRLYPTAYAKRTDVFFGCMY